MKALLILNIMCSLRTAKDLACDNDVVQVVPVPADAVDAYGNNIYISTTSQMLSQWYADVEISLVLPATLNSACDLQTQKVLERIPSSDL